MRNKHRKYYSISRALLASTKSNSLLHSNSENKKVTSIVSEDNNVKERGIQITNDSTPNNIRNNLSNNRLNESESSFQQQNERQRLWELQNQMRELQQIENDSLLIDSTNTPTHNPYKPIYERQMEQRKIHRPKEKFDYRDIDFSREIENAPKGDFNIGDRDAMWA